MPEIQILVATMTGTAELAAEEMEEVLVNAGHAVSVALMDDLEPSVFEPGRVYVICSSTYGQGDVPDNGLGLYYALEADAPNLSGVLYGVFALGDRTYIETFCGGGESLDRRLTGLGAQRVGEVYRHDASSHELAEDKAAPWALEWLEALKRHLQR